jgi:hypothetical protein
MSRHRRGLPTPLAVGVAVVTGLLAGCGPSHTTVASSPVVPPVATPLASVTTTADAAYATIPMGHLDQLANTFWQLIVLPAGTRTWRLRTPLGVADNGGLVVSTTGPDVVAGFVPSLDLVFSPLASSTDEGAQYQTGLLDAGLDAVPDALASVPGGTAAALAGGRLWTSAAGLTGWRRSLDPAQLAAAPAGRACAPTTFTAVLVLAGGGDLLGAACRRPGAVGLYERSPGAGSSGASAWTAAGPVLPSSDTTAGSVRVIRLVATATGTAAVLGVGPSTYVAAWRPAGGTTWASSAPLVAAGPLRATAVAADGEVVLETGPASGPTVHVTRPATGSWSALPTAPSGTAAVVPVANGPFVALVGHNSTLTIEQETAGSWVKEQTLDVPIAYGSSS